MRRVSLWRNRLIWAGLFVLSLILITWKGGSVSYGLFAACLIFPALSFAYLIYVFFSFRIYQETGSKTIEKEGETSYRFVLTNEFPLVDSDVAVSFYGETTTVTGAPEENWYTMFRGESVVYETTLKGLVRGEHPVGIREVTVLDYLHLFCLKYHVMSEIKVTVSPRVPKLSALRQLALPKEDMEKEQAFPKTEPDVLVRDYQPGDEKNRIYWKASARAGKLQVRERIGQGQPQVGIFLDLMPGSEASSRNGEGKRWFSLRRRKEESVEALKEEDTRLECLLALGAYLVREGERADRTGPASGRNFSGFNAGQRGVFPERRRQKVVFSSKKKGRVR